MCAGAIYWSKVGRVVYALSAHSLYTLTGSRSGLNLPTSRAILEVGGVDVCGPALEEDALVVHIGFWDGSERGT
jgi:tRNA(Arg) A34 adenosine deaminase TadA